MAAFLMYRFERGGEDGVTGKLTERQKRFVDFYIELGNATEAARRAGYKKPHVEGARLLANARVQTAIEARLKEIEAKRVASATEVLQTLTSALRGEMQEEVVIVEGTGEGRSRARTMKKQVSAKDRIAAAKELLKRYPTKAVEEMQSLEIEKLKTELKEKQGDTQTEGITFLFSRKGAAKE